MVTVLNGLGESSSNNVQCFREGIVGEDEELSTICIKDSRGEESGKVESCHFGGKDDVVYGVNAWVQVEVAG